MKEAIDNERLARIVPRVADEIARGEAAWGRGYTSDHEAFAVLLEEVDEVKAWVWRKREHRNRAAMLKELVQVAAVAQRWAVHLLDGEPCTVRTPGEGVCGNSLPCHGHGLTGLRGAP